MGGFAGLYVEATARAKLAMTPPNQPPPEPFPFRWNRNGALDFGFDAFS
jgi:hypothetical protein